MCMKEKLDLFVCFCGCTDNVIQPSAAYIFPFISIFNLSQSISFTCMRWLRCWVVFFFLFMHPFQTLNCVCVTSSLFWTRCLLGNVSQPSEARHNDSSPLSILSQCHPAITEPLCAFSHHTSAGCIADMNASSCPIPAAREGEILRVFLFLLPLNGIVLLLAAS